MRRGFVFEVAFGAVHELAAHGAEFVLAFEHDFVAEGLLDFLGVHLRHAFEAFADGFGEAADGVARLLDGGVFAGEAFGALFELVVEEGEGFFVGADFAEFDVGFDVAAVELAVEFGAFGGDFLLGFLA